MNKPLQVLFNGIERSDAVEDHVREKVAKLEHHHPQITACRVTIAMPHNRQHQGKRYDVRIDLSIPGKELVVNRDHGDEDMYVTLRDAFDAVKRQLDEHVRAQRGEVKHHPDKTP
jgi:ribosomal subunit interface protein